MALDEEIEKMKYPFSDKNMEPEIYIDIPDLSKYIKSVMVHPQAEQWIVDLVEKLCSRKDINIKFLGKSHMYDEIGKY